MNSAMIELLILAAIAVFVFLRLKNVLGTRTGFERPTRPDEPRAPIETPRRSRDFEVIDGGGDGADLDADIARAAGSDSETGAALRRMAKAEPASRPRPSSRAPSAPTR